jgi:hypothetical protein
MSTSTSTPVTLSFEAIDDLIYDARVGDLDALKADLATQSKEHNCPEAWIIASAIDAEPEAEGGSGSCLLHFPAANGNAGMFDPTGLDSTWLLGCVDPADRCRNLKLSSGNSNRAVFCGAALGGEDRGGD